MKLVLLMYLEDDEKCVARLLRSQRIEAFTRLSVQGHGPGSAGGWSGEIQPFDSQIIMSVLSEEQARTLMSAVAKCTEVQDPRHPIRAALLNVEEFSCCEIARP